VDGLAFIAGDAGGCILPGEQPPIERQPVVGILPGGIKAVHHLGEVE
jgi:hypothetical protein